MIDPSPALDTKLHDIAAEFAWGCLTVEAKQSSSCRNKEWFASAGGRMGSPAP